MTRWIDCHFRADTIQKGEGNLNNAMKERIRKKGKHRNPITEVYSRNFEPKLP